MKRGRPRATRSAGELVGMGSAELPLRKGEAEPLTVLCALGQFRDPDDDDTLRALGDAWASYQADVAALALRPSRADEFADCAAIRDGIADFLARTDAARASALLRRLDRFPPLSRGTFSTESRHLLVFECALRDARAGLPFPELWPSLTAALEVIAAACALADPPPFTKRPKAARDRFIAALSSIYDADPEADASLRDEFVRAMLAAFKVDAPDRF